ncbi:tetratricopeptide repeat protein [candidate division KSB1 bacterium]|nr:tetratricopeptide repeat protein [candidate division KSB1 bacterium]RQW09455.1 MAG: hypothetical protein EH222_03910 [candidate division KSB1 bacterium]
MNSVYILYVTVFIILLLLIVLFVFHRKPKRKYSIQAEYINGLHALVEGDKETALARLRNVVRHDTDYIDAYILIGNIFRDIGMVENAIKVHRDLLVRPNLSVEHQKTILSNLVLNYKKNGQPKWALATCDKILAIDKKNQWAKESKLGLYEDMADWQGAYDILKKNKAIDRLQKDARLAAYKIEQGLQLSRLQQEHDARLCFRDAIRLDGLSFGAYLELVHSYIRDGRKQDALKELKRTIQALPEYADIAINEFEELLYDLGEFDAIESFYKQIISANPKLSAAQMALAEIYEKKGELVKAAEYARKVLQNDPKNQHVLLFLIQIDNKLRRYESAALLSEQVAETFSAKRAFRCKHCGQQQGAYFWRCPACATWNSAERV